MRTVTKTYNLYTFDELRPAAKQTAREWWLNGLEFNGESVIADATSIADLFGLCIDKVYYTGFYSQGDGAMFVGHYRYKKGALAAVKAYAPLDTGLHEIVRRINEIQRRNFYSICANITQRHGTYVNEYMMDMEVYRADSGPLTPADEGALIHALRDYARWIYHQLRDQYEYETSDENVDEILATNGYEFDEDGNRRAL